MLILYESKFILRKRIKEKKKKQTHKIWDN